MTTSHMTNKMEECPVTKIRNHQERSMCQPFGPSFDHLQKIRAGQGREPAAGCSMVKDCRLRHEISTNDKDVILLEFVLGHLQIIRCRPLASTARHVVVTAVAWTKPTAPVACICEGHTSQMGAHAHQHKPLHTSPQRQLSSKGRCESCQRPWQISQGIERFTWIAVASRMTIACCHQNYRCPLVKPIRNQYTRALTAQFLMLHSKHATRLLKADSH